eukprot:gene1351-32713_t
MSGFGLGADIRRDSEFDDRELDAPPPPRPPAPMGGGGGFGLAAELPASGSQKPPLDGISRLEPVRAPIDPKPLPPRPPLGQGPSTSVGGFGLAEEARRHDPPPLGQQGALHDDGTRRQSSAGGGYGLMQPPRGDRPYSGIGSRPNSPPPPPPPLPGPTAAGQYGGQQSGPQYDPNRLPQAQLDPRMQNPTAYGADPRKPPVGSYPNPGDQTFNANRPPLQPYDPNRPNQQQYDPNRPNQQQYDPNRPNQQQYDPNRPNQQQYDSNRPNQQPYDPNRPNQQQYDPNQPSPLHAGLQQPGGSPPQGPIQPLNQLLGGSFSQGGAPPGPPFDTQQMQGLNYEEQQQVMMQQQHSSMISPLFSMHDLPPDERYLQLTPFQANEVIQQLDAAKANQPYMGGPETKVLDVKDAHSALMDSLGTRKMTYINQVELATAGGRFPTNARPSVLQAKLKDGRHRLQDLAQPVMDPGNQSFVDLTYSADGALKPETRCSMFSFAPVKVEGVGPTGLKGIRSPCLFVSRLALFDRQHNKFIGNVLGLRPHSVVSDDSAWLFDPKVSHTIVRCSVLQADPRTGTRMINDEYVSLYVEFNTAYRLTVEDTRGMPASEQKASQMVDEITTCWAMIAVRKCSLLSKEMEVSVPLYYGSVYEPQLLDALYKAERKKSRLSFLKSKEKPVFTFKIGPCGQVGQLAPLVPYGFMPPTMIALDDLAAVLGAYRLNLALQLARQATTFTAISEPVLARFPDILGDHHLLSEFLLKWRDITKKLCAMPNGGCLSPEVLPPIATLVEAFRRCCIEIMPLVQCASIPPRHINNFVEYQGNRLKQVQQFCHVIDPKTNVIVGARHPVEPLSHAGFEFLHKPFDTSEIRLSMADRLQKKVNFLKY